MADFCAQCAGDGFPSDFVGVEDGVPVLCEGCGPTFVDADGRCISDCWQKHGQHHVDPPPMDHRFFEVVGHSRPCTCALCATSEEAPR